MTKTTMLYLTLSLAACGGKEQDCKQLGQTMESSGVTKVDAIPAAAERHAKPADVVPRLRAYAQTIKKTHDALSALDIKTPEVQAPITAYIAATSGVDAHVTGAADRYEKYATVRAQEEALFAAYQQAHADLLKACEVSKDPGCATIRALGSLPATAKDPWSKDLLDFESAINIPRSKFKDAQARAKLEALLQAGSRRSTNSGPLKVATEDLPSTDQSLDEVIAKERPLAVTLPAACATK